MKKTQMEEFVPRKRNEVVCQYTSLSEVPSSADLSAYEGSEPFDYSGGLEKGDKFLLLGIVFQSGKFKLYLSTLEDEIEIEVKPVVLFQLGATNLLFSASMVTQSHGDKVEIIPERLAEIERWFERYIDEEEAVVRVVESEIRRLRSLS